MRVEAPRKIELVAATQGLKDQLNLKRHCPIDLDRTHGIRHAVYPVAAVHVVIE